MITFSSAYKGGRPVRLSEATRRFADESLHGKYGTQALEFPYVSMDSVESFPEMGDYERYDAMIRKIALEAPVRMAEEERISGSASLGVAMRHLIPAFYGDRPVFGSISHLTCNFEEAVDRGMDAFEAEILEKLSEADSLPERSKRFLTSLKNTMDSFRIWHGRYLAEVGEKKPEVYQALLKVPFGKPESFFEAVQALWFDFAFLRLCGNWPGIGRIDVILGKYLKNDLEKGVLTTDEAREILASFFIKGCEWIEENTQPGSGDAQHYQNLVLGGVDEEGRQVENEVTYLVLDVVEELPIGDFPITVRLNRNSPERLLTRIAEVQRHGSGVVAVYNEETVLKAMQNYGYSLKEARNFANDGCWETQIPGRTFFTYHPFDGLQILLNNVLRVRDGGCPEYGSFDELYEAYYEALKNHVQNGICGNIFRCWLKEPEKAGSDYVCFEPSTAVALFEKGCVERAKDYREGGPLYTVISPHIGGAPDVGNSLHAIDLLVYREKKLSLSEFVKILSENWEGNEALRLYCRNKIGCYGNDEDEADAYTVRVLDDFARITAEVKNPNMIVGPGVSTFGRQLEWRGGRTAVPFGMKENAILAGNCSPTPGTDYAGATSIIRSYCKADLSKQLTGAALDIKLLPSSVDDENGVEAIKGLLRGFVELGGYFMQTDVIDGETLKKARENPEEYKTLSVRVSGWNARFVTLNREWQDMIIERTAQGI